jgi:hypothetical protein
MLITSDLVQNTWYSFYPDNFVHSLFYKPCTPAEVLIRTDGDWATVGPKDRLWLALHDECIKTKELHLFAARCVRRVRDAYRNHFGVSDAFVFDICSKADSFLTGGTTVAELRDILVTLWSYRTLSTCPATRTLVTILVEYGHSILDSIDGEYGSVSRAVRSVSLECCDFFNIIDEKPISSEATVEFRRQIDDLTFVFAFMDAYPQPEKPVTTEFGTHEFFHK